MVEIRSFFRFRQNFAGTIQPFDCPSVWSFRFLESTIRLTTVTKVLNCVINNVAYDIRMVVYQEPKAPHTSQLTVWTLQTLGEIKEMKKFRQFFVGRAEVKVLEVFLPRTRVLQKSRLMCFRADEALSGSYHLRKNRHLENNA